MKIMYSITERLTTKVAGTGLYFHIEHFFICVSKSIKQQKYLQSLLFQEIIPISEYNIHV